MQRQWLGGAVIALLICGPAWAADHLDGPAASADPAADITDVFSWMSSDGSHLNLVMDLAPAADATSKFSNSVQYVFHTSSRGSFGTAASKTLDVICTFEGDQTLSCWAGDEYVNGNASDPAGISSASGKLKVFAGLRNDPFFFNLDGFKATAAAVTAAKPSLTFDAAFCPALDNNTSTALVNTLKSDGHGGNPHDFFLGLNVLAIVVTVDKSLVTSGGSLVSVWASTHRTP